MTCRCKIVKTISFIVMLGGLLVMVGWLLDISVLKSILPQYVAMKFTTALCFVLSGATLYFVCRNYQREEQANDLTIIFIDFLIVLVMVSLLLSIFFRIETGMENLFVIEPDGAIDTPVAGRPSMFAMIDFILVALAGLLSLVKKTSVVIAVRGLGLLVAASGIMAVIGYIIKAPLLYGHFGLYSSAIALHSAALFVLLGLGFSLVGKNFLNNQRQ